MQIFAYFFVQISAESHLQLSRASTVIVVPVDMCVVTEKRRIRRCDTCALVVLVDVAKANDMWNYLYNSVAVAAHIHAALTSVAAGCCHEKRIGSRFQQNHTF